MPATDAPVHAILPLPVATDVQYVRLFRDRMKVFLNRPSSLTLDGRDVRPGSPAYSHLKILDGVRISNSYGSGPAGCADLLGLLTTEVTPYEYLWLALVGDTSNRLVNRCPQRFVGDRVFPGVSSRKRRAFMRKRRLFMTVSALQSSPP